ncbi:hypothetical protein THAOC_06102, partial [Thalassiosira oceanica]
PGRDRRPGTGEDVHRDDADPAPGGRLQSRARNLRAACFPVRHGRLDGCQLRHDIGCDPTDRGEDTIAQLQSGRLPGEHCEAGQEGRKDRVALPRIVRRDARVRTGVSGVDEGPDRAGPRAEQGGELLADGGGAPRVERRRQGLAAERQPPRRRERGADRLLARLGRDGSRGGTRREGRRQADGGPAVPGRGPAAGRPRGRRVHEHAGRHHARERRVRGRPAREPRAARGEGRVRVPGRRERDLGALDGHGRHVLGEGHVAAAEEDAEGAAAVAGPGRDGQEPALGDVDDHGRRDGRREAICDESIRERSVCSGTAPARQPVPLRQSSRHVRCRHEGKFERIRSVGVQHIAEGGIVTINQGVIGKSIRILLKLKGGSSDSIQGRLGLGNVHVRPRGRAATSTPPPPPASPSPASRLSNSALPCGPRAVVARRAASVSVIV